MEIPEADEALNPEEELRNFAFEILCTTLGYALCTWQGVERSHFNLFLKMLAAPNWEVCSAAYYSIESFEARHRMVSRVAHYFLKDDRYKVQRSIWSSAEGGLEKAIKDANTNRNKIAHYGLDYDAFETIRRPDNVKVELSFPRFRPAPHNLVDRLMGRTPDRAEHDLSAKEISDYGEQFHKLADRIEGFQESITLPPRHEPAPPPRPALVKESQSLLTQIPTKSPPTDAQPSG